MKFSTGWRDLGVLVVVKKSSGGGMVVRCGEVV